MKLPPKFKEMYKIVDTKKKQGEQTDFKSLGFHFKYNFSAPKRSDDHNKKYQDKIKRKIISKKGKDHNPDERELLSKSSDAHFGHINRFAARYSLAKSFNGISLIGYKTDKTKDAYYHEIKSFLTYTAFEQFKFIIGEHDNLKLIGIIKNEKLSKEIYKILVDDEQIYYFLYENLELDILANKVEAFYKNHKFNNVLYLAEALRHKFGHGDLTSNFSKISLITEKITTLLFKIMDDWCSKNIKV